MTTATIPTVNGVWQHIIMPAQTLEL